jgi:catechol 2,3-dioxygenase-like lactoylglutathione lyase family enzyme
MRLLNFARHRARLCVYHVGRAGLGTGTLSRGVRHRPARAELVDRGVDVSEVFHRTGPGQPPLSGPDPERRSYASFATFSDPDGNGWLLQEATVR